MNADLRVFVIVGEEPPKTCIGAASARTGATERVRRGEPGVQIVNAGREAFRWWPELCSERGCCSPAEEGASRCALHAVQERRARKRPAVDAGTPEGDALRPPRARGRGKSARHAPVGPDPGSAEVAP